MSNIIYNVAIMGLGAIVNRHLSAINANEKNFKIIGVYDTNIDLLNKYSNLLNCKAYKNEEEVYKDNNINCVIILTPSNLHFSQAVKAIKNQKHVIVEKPATFLVSELNLIERVALENSVSVYTILQVRLNPAISIAKKIIDGGFLGDLSGASLVQRWQRPASYFTGWRGSMAESGGILREFGIHYLDAMQYLVGLPQVKHACFYNNKFDNTDVADTIYALFDFGAFGGSAEISVACEPKNLECSLSIYGKKGFIKLGGRSLDEILSLELLGSDLNNSQIDEIKTQELAKNKATLATQGASPYHPELYRQIIQNPERFVIGVTHNVAKLIQNIFEFNKVLV